MKSTIRIALLVAVSVVPALVFAQPYTGGPYTQTTNTGYSSGFISTSGGVGPGIFSPGSCTGAGIGCVANTVLYLINSVLVPLLFAISFIVFLYGVAKTYIFSHGEAAEVSEGHKLILWGVIGFVVMVSLWGLVNVVANTFGLWGTGAPNLPTSY